MKIRTKFILIMMIFVFIVFAIMYLMFSQISKNRAIENINNHINTAVKFKSNNIGTLLKTYKKTTELLAAGIPFRQFFDTDVDQIFREKSLRNRINSVIKVNDSISRIRILNNDGIVVASSHEDIGMDRSNSKIFLEGKKGTYIGDFHFSGFTGEYVLSISTPIYVNGKISGVLIINLDAAKQLFPIIADKTGFAHSTNIYLLNRDHYLIYPIQYGDIVLETKIHPEPLKLCYSDHLKNNIPEMNLKNFVIYTNYRNKKVIGTHIYIPEMQWFLIVEVDETEMIAPIIKYRNILTLLFSILFIISFCVSYILSIFFTKPLKKLETGVQKIIDGNMDYKVATKSKDEIGQLSRIFDEMSTKLFKSKKELEIHTRNLEEQVEHRTTELNKQFEKSEQQRIGTLNVLKDLDNINVSLKAEIIEHKQTEEKLIESENRYKYLYNEAPVSIWEEDFSKVYKYLQSLKKKGINNLRNYFEKHFDEVDKCLKMMYVVDINDTTVKLFHAKSKKELLTNLDSIITKESYPSFIEQLCTIARDETHYNGESINKTFDGNIINVSLNWSVVPEYEKDYSKVLVSLIDITERKQAGKIQQTLFNISNALNTTENLSDLYSKIRDFLGNVIDTTNFYVALYDEKTDMLSLPFDLNEKDKYKSFPTGKTLTKYVIQTEKPLFANSQLIDELVEQGKIELIGTPSLIWLGVPLKIENKIIGVVAVQSYNDPNLYTEKDIELISFVSDEIALAINKRKAEEQMLRDLKEKSVLLQEIYHRTKNNMQVVSSMLKLQTRNIESRIQGDSKDIEFIYESFNTVINKIKAMSLVHQKLYEAKDLSHINLKEYIGDLVRSLMASYRIRSESISLELNLEDVFLLIDSAIPLGLVLSELISNVFKHGYKTDEKVEIVIRLFKDDDDVINIHLSDNGDGIPSDIKLEDVSTMGLQTVFSLVEFQLKGKITYKTENGLKWKISFKDNLHEVRV